MNSIGQIITEPNYHDKVFQEGMDTVVFIFSSDKKHQATQENFITNLIKSKTYLKQHGINSLNFFMVDMNYDDNIQWLIRQELRHFPQILLYPAYNKETKVFRY